MARPKLDPFACGLLLGFSPLILLFGLGIMVVVLGSLSLDERAATPTRARVAIVLPSIDPTQPDETLLPTPPKVVRAPVYIGDNLSFVPTIALEAVPQLSKEEWKKRKASDVAAAIHLDRKVEDGYLKTLLATRPDLAGLPFAMGGKCRTTGERAKAFKDAVTAIRSQSKSFVSEINNEDEREHVYQAHIAAIHQVMPAEDSSTKNSLLRTLSAVPRPEATRMLARMAVFSTDDSIRTAAIEALTVRREADATDVLVAGLSYPWPGIAENAADAIVKLKRRDLIPQLEAMHTASDPRGPRTEELNGRQETVAHELVRVNHLQNCQLCHAPAEAGKTPSEALTALMPIPSIPLTGEGDGDGGGYGQPPSPSAPPSPIVVRVDVTYLRQDFSTMQRVSEWTADSWSPIQRFDFLVRRRVLTPAEAADLRTRLQGESPYQRAAVKALQALKEGEAKAAVKRGPA
jgi:hypothetical protein